MKLILSLLIIAFSFGARGEEKEFYVPAIGGGVVDDAGLMSSSAAAALSNALISIYQKGGPQVAVVTVPSIGEIPVEDAAIKIAREWKLGTAEKDNGVLLLIAKKQRKIRIEVGQGVEGDLTDAYSRRIIDNDMVPLLRQGDTTQAILAGVDGILKRMNPPIHLEDYLEVPEQRFEGGRKGSWVHLLILLFVFILFTIGGGGGRRRRGFASDVATGMVLGSIFGGGRSGGGGGGFGGGGWSGGGGGFSGGGASGSW